MNTGNSRERLGPDRLFVEGLRSWIPAFAGMTLQSPEDPQEPIDCGP
jgi:hypothetical protein